MRRRQAYNLSRSGYDTLDEYKMDFADSPPGESKMRKAEMRKEWGEVGLGSSKRDGWAWEVYLYEVDGDLYDRRTFSWYKADGWYAACNCMTDWAQVENCKVVWSN